MIVCFFVGLIFIGFKVCLGSFFRTIENIVNDSPKIVSTCLLTIIFIEGGDLLLARLNDSIKKHREKERIAKEEGIAEGEQKFFNDLAEFIEQNGENSTLKEFMENHNIKIKKPNESKD